MLTHKTLSIASLITCLLSAVCGGGCGSSLQKNPPATASDTTASASQGELFVEMHEADDEVFHLKAPFKDSMFVEDALRESGAKRRYRRMDITLVRQLPTGQKLRMPVKYNLSAKAVTPATNYSLHPNDTLEIVQDNSTTLDRMLDSALDPLQPIMR